MTDHATPNLPSADFDRTVAFYKPLGFEQTWRDEGWLILERGTAMVEFFALTVDPASSGFGCCLRLDDVDAFVAKALAAGVPETTLGWPRVHRARPEPWGGRVGALIDPDGTLLRLVEARRD